MSLIDGRKAIAGVAALALVFGFADAGRAETIESALVRAYQNNPQLNAQRAAARATDELVPQALSGYRPRVAVTASAGTQFLDTTTRVGEPPTYTDLRGHNAPRSVGASVQQSLFNGYQTANRVRGAESQVSSAREGLRVLEQTVLLTAATFYMDYLRDAAIVEVRRSNVRVLEQTLKQVQDRFSVGEVTRTDVAQSEAQLAAGRSTLLSAESTLNTTRANYRRVIGNEPVALQPGTPVDRFLPATLPAAIEIGMMQNPNVTAAMYGIDIAFLTIKVAEGALFPTLNLVASVQASYESSLVALKTISASAVAQLQWNVYDGGNQYSLIRQSKETLAQQRLVLDQARDQARATIVEQWGRLQAAKAQISSAQAQVTASETALNGVREEARVGQRTTLDVLNAQQALVDARVSIVTAQHDRVVASYGVLQAVGRLSPQVLGLATTVYDPSVHYHQVRDAWTGVRVPDGR
jgi:outer membrane protein